MLKILRKHNKWFMVVFGTLLMLTFLIDRGASGAADTGKRVVAETRDGKIRLRDVQAADSEYGLLNRLTPMMVRAEYSIEGGMHWLLLSRQAERMGLVGDEQDGESWIGELIQTELYTERLVGYMRQGIPASFARQFLDQQGAQLVQEAQQQTEAIRSRRAQIAGEFRLTEKQFGQTLAKLRGVSRLQRLYVGAAVPSDKRAIMQFRRERDAVLVSGVFIPAESIVDTIPEPEPARIQAQYDTYRTLKPGTGDLGFGYVQEPRFKIEWIRLSRAEISAQIKLDAIAVHKHWQVNRARFPGEFDAEEAAVEKELRDRQIEAVMNTADRLIKDRVRAALTRLPVDGPYRKLPETWAKDGPTLEGLSQEVVDAVRTGVSVTLAKPVLERPETEWVELSKLGALKGIGESYFRAGQSRNPFEVLIGLCKELAPQTNLDLQAKVPFTTVVMENAEGDHFYFTVTDVKLEGPPESLDAVKANVIADLKKLDAYKKLSEEIGVHRTLAATSDIKALASVFKKPGAPAGGPQPLDTFDSVKVTQVAVSRGELNTDELRNAVLDAAAKLGPVIAVTAENKAERTLAVALPKSFGIGVVQITGQSPVVVEDLRRLNPYFADSLANSELQGVFQELATPGALSYAMIAEAVGLKNPDGTPMATDRDDSAGKPGKRSN
ncbi:MAG: hypothetical protein ACOYN0_13905 [Phycisphaerales bacterium]